MVIDAGTASLYILINALHGTIIKKEKYKKGLISNSEYEEYLDAAERAIKKSTENATKILMGIQEEIVF